MRQATRPGEGADMTKGSAVWKCRSFRASFAATLNYRAIKRQGASGVNPRLTNSLIDIESQSHVCDIRHMPNNDVEFYACGPLTGIRPAHGTFTVTPHKENQGRSGRDSCESLKQAAALRKTVHNSPVPIRLTESQLLVWAGRPDGGAQRKRLPRSA